MDRYKRLLSNTFIFALGTFGSKLMVYLVLPLVTSVLTTAEMGVADLLQQTGNLLLPLVSLGINNAIIRFGLDNANNPRQVFSGGVAALAVGYGVFLLIWPLAGYLFTALDYQAVADRLGLVYLFVLSSTTRSLFSNFVRSQKRVKLFAVDGMLSTALTLFFYLVFLLKLSRGIQGYIVAIVCADACSSLFLFFAAKLWQYFRISGIKWTLLSPMLRYCMPLIPSTVLWQITNVCSRYMITGTLGESASGLFAISNKLPTLIALVSTIFTEAWQISAISEQHSDSRGHFFSQVFAGYRSLIFTAASGLILICRPLMSFMVSKSFYDAWQFVPFLVMGTSFNCFVNFSGTVYMVEKRSVAMLATTVVGVVVNVLLNVFLVPVLGVQGSALATLAAYFTVFALRLVHMRRFFVMNWGLLPVLVNTLALLAQSLVLIAQPNHFYLYQVIIFLAIAVLNLSGLLATLKRLLPQKLAQKLFRSGSHE